jgi:transcription antitermination factor NusG
VTGNGAAILSCENLNIMERKIGWHVLYVRYKHERKIYTELIEKNIEAFLPMTTVVKKWSDRIKKIQTPLFPSYVFVNIQSNKDFHEVLTGDVACSYVRFGNEFGKVSQKEIDQIKMLIEGKEVADIQLTNELPKIGDKLKIRYGELSGLECEVLRIGNRNKINVRLNSLRQNISATIPLSYMTRESGNSFA